MRIKIIMFAALAQRAGVRELLVDLPDQSKVSDALAMVETTHPAVAEIRSKLAAAVNLSYVDVNEPLHDGDELALIPPVSGG